MYAIVEIAGKQFKVEENAKVYVPRLKADVDSTVTIDRVLLMSGDGNIRIGAPTVADTSLTATVLRHVKGDKVLIFKKKRRKRYRVKRGHRQQYTQIRIDAFPTGSAKKTKRSKAEAE